METEYATFDVTSDITFNSIIGYDATVIGIDNTMFDIMVDSTEEFLNELID